MLREHIFDVSASEIVEFADRPVLAYTPLRCPVLVGDSTCGAADRGGGCHIQRRGPQGVLKFWGVSAQLTSHGNVFFRGAGKRATTNCLT